MCSFTLHFANLQIRMSKHVFKRKSKNKKKPPRQLTETYKMHAVLTVSSQSLLFVMEWLNASDQPLFLVCPTMMRLDDWKMFLR